MAVLNAKNSEDGRQIVRQQVARIPREVQPGALQALIRRFEATQFPDWGEVPIALCRVDSNILNFVRRPEQWMSVDWENSGWGDPAFEIADLMTHVAYVDVPASQWDRVIEMYCKLVDDATAAVRVRTYYKILLVWWVARLVRYLYEIPKGIDKRLAAWPPDWQEDLQAKYERYLKLAETLYF
jgi:thiamine kinase-like enzyme